MTLNSVFTMIGVVGITLTGIVIIDTMIDAVKARRRARRDRHRW